MHLPNNICSTNLKIYDRCPSQACIIFETENLTISGLLLQANLYSTLPKYCFPYLLIFILLFSYPISAGELL